MEAMSEPSPPVTTPADANPAPAAPDATGPARVARDSGAPKTPMSAAPLAGSVAASTATTQAVPATAAEDRAAQTGVQFPTRAPITPTTTASTVVPPPSPMSAGSVGGALFSLILVVALILALGWLARRMPGVARNSNVTGLRVVASLPIGQRERLLVVEVGDTQLLIGAGPGGIQTLHTLEQPLQESPAATGPSPFAQLLAQHFGKQHSGKKTA